MFLGGIGEHSPVAVGWDEVQAAVHPVVLQVSPVQSVLVREVLPELLVDIVDASAPRLLAVDTVAKTLSRIGKLKLEEKPVLFQYLFFVKVLPGVSTMVRRSLTPLSSMSMLFFSICVVFSKRSAKSISK